MAPSCLTCFSQHCKQWQAWGRWANCLAVCRKEDEILNHLVLQEEQVVLTTSWVVLEAARKEMKLLLTLAGEGEALNSKGKYPSASFYLFLFLFYFCRDRESLTLCCSGWSWTASPKGSSIVGLPKCWNYRPQPLCLAKCLLLAMSLLLKRLCAYELLWTLLQLKKKKKSLLTYHVRSAAIYTAEPGGSPPCSSLWKS